MKLSFYLIVSLVAIFTTGCLREDSENVNQDKIWAAYELFYDGSSDITHARVTFRFGHLAGTKLQLTEPSEVRFNGDPLDFKSGLAYYEQDYAGFVNEGSFEFTDLNGNVYINDITIHTVDFPSTWGSLQHGSSFELIWEGSELSPNESMSLTINGATGGSDQIFIENDNFATSMILSASQISDLGVGASIAYLDRIYTPGIQDATNAGGMITGKYRTTNSGVNISE